MLPQNPLFVFMASDLPVKTRSGRHSAIDLVYLYGYDTSFSYYVDVEVNQKFISCCGPGEWAVCNCLSESDDYLIFVHAEDSVESKETEDLSVLPHFET